jgi:hypothetical protein
VTATDETLTARRTPSVSELQAALLAARNGQFASPKTTPVVAAAPPPRPEVATPQAAASVASPPAGPPTGAAPSGGTGVWLLGTHGGSGVRCLATVLAGTRSAGKLWPAPASDREPVVLVCRGNQRGLSSAQEYARIYRDRELGEHLDLLGVIVSADAPGRVPPPLRRLERLLSGAVPILGRVPWEPTWRLGPPTAAGEPLPWVGQLAQALAAAAVAR